MGSLLLDAPTVVSDVRCAGAAATSITYQRRMTLLGACALSPDRLIVGADRLLSSTDSTQSSMGGYGDKWTQVGTLPLMWGLSGSGYGELDCAECVESLTSLPSWADVAEIAPSQMRLVNGRYSSPDLYFDLMLAGFIGDEAGIISVTARGTLNYPDGLIGTQARFLGLSSWGADLAFSYLQQESPQAITDESFGRLMRLASSRDPGLRGFTTWEITIDGCRRLDEYEPGA